MKKSSSVRELVRSRFQQANILILLVLMIWPFRFTVIYGDKGCSLMIVGGFLREIELFKRLEEAFTVVGHFNTNLGLRG